MKKIILYWLPFILCLSVIYFLSTLSKPVSTGINTGFFHPIEFFVLAFLLLRVFYAYKVKYAFVLTIAVVALLGGIDEIIQGYTTGRTSCLSDVFLDFLGACFIVIFKFKKLKWLIR